MILVTGGSGFIGSALIKGLNQVGKTNIIVVDRLEKDQKWKNLRQLSYAEFIHADDLFKVEYSWAFENLETIFHMGACSSTTERDVDFLMKNNVDYSKRIWRASVQAGAMLIYASSAATYGGGKQGYEDSHDKINSLRPLNPYGYSKQVFDQWALTQSKAPDAWYGLKFFNVYGPNEYHKGEMRSLVHKAFEQIHQSGKVKLFKSHREGFKDGEQLRDFIYVQDVVRAMLNLEQKNKAFGLYNMGTSQARSFYDLVDNTFKAMNVQTNIEFIDMPLSIRDQYQYFTEACMKKYQKLCPEHSFLSLEDGVKDYVQNYLMKDCPYL